MLKENGVIVLKRDLGEPIYRHLFLMDMCEVNYFFEPNTASTIINYFLLKPGIYGIRMELYTGVGYTPVIQEIFGAEPGDLRQVLRDKIDSCSRILPCKLKSDRS